MTRAFTIIEMLVVIGILAVLMGLTVGAISSTKRSDKLLATEHLIGDMIRQARHTARTSGAPVVVLVEKNPARVQGVSQIPIWTEDFDGTGIAGNVPAGLTGTGFQINVALGDNPPAKTLDPNERLARRAGYADGFYISCNVMPPNIGNGSGAPPIIPLVVIGTPVSGVITRSASVCGLVLRAQSLPLQIVDGADGQGAGTGEQAYLRTWEVVGWIGDGTDDPKEVSSIELDDRPKDIPRDEKVMHQSVDIASLAHPQDVAVPLTGGRWVELGMLFEPSKDSWRIILYRDGMRIAERQFKTAPVVRHDDETVVIGQVEIIASGVPTTHTATSVFDGIRIARLASADPTPLPGDIVPDQDYRIIAHPDGRVEVHQAGGTPWANVKVNLAGTTAPVDGNILTFTGSFSKAAKASLTISVDGRIDGKLVTQ